MEGLLRTGGREEGDRYEGRVATFGCFYVYMTFMMNSDDDFS
jgi:hypothetical protein